ncbi:FAD/NAD(P)-binding protein, partial [Leuconostoc pseudomesenteroides]
MQVAIIGAGPRGLAVAERLINLDDSDNQLDVQIFDPYAIGGRVWDPTIKQNNLFLMNTVIDQVTLFNDDSIENG